MQALLAARAIPGARCFCYESIVIYTSGICIGNLVPRRQGSGFTRDRIPCMTTRALRFRRIPLHIAYQEMKGHGLCQTFLGGEGPANRVQEVHWMMRDILSLNAQSYGASGSNGLTRLRDYRQLQCKHLCANTI